MIDPTSREFQRARVWLGRKPYHNVAGAYLICDESVTREVGTSGLTARSAKVVNYSNPSGDVKAHVQTGEE